MTYDEVLESLGKDDFFGVLAGASTSEIVIYARNLDTSIGDLFLIPSDRGGERVFCVPTETAQFFTSTVALAALFETLMAFVIADARDEVVASIDRFHRRRHEIGVYWNEEE